MLLLMSMAYGVSTLGLSSLMVAPAVFAFGLVAFGFLGMGPVTIAVDSYGPVTDNAQSVYELSLIEQIPGIESELKREENFSVDFERAKYLLEANDGAGNAARDKDRRQIENDFPFSQVFHGYMLMRIAESAMVAGLGSPSFQD